MEEGKVTETILRENPPVKEPAGASGLASAEAARRLKQYGENAIAEKRESLLLKLAAYFWGPIPWMIEAAAILSAAVGRWADFIVIVSMLLINAGVGFFEEKNANDAIAALKQRLALMARVKRDGEWRDIAARELVPDDLIFVKLGNIVPADAKAAKGDYLSIDQSALTGESLPVDKKAGDTLYSGSIVRQGQMEAVVTATGMEHVLRQDRQARGNGGDALAFPAGRASDR